MKYNKISLLIGVFILGLQADFNKQLNYQINMPKNSSWGIFKSSGSLPQLKISCQADSLEKSSIFNNNGLKGLMTGASAYFQLCPSLQNGVQYWNPLEIVNRANPCYMSNFSAFFTDKTKEDCAGFDTMIFGNYGTQLEAATLGTGSSVQQKLLQQLATEHSYSSFMPEYQSLYESVKEQAQFLVAMNDQLKPDIQGGKDFFSVPYLAFAATFVDDFVTADSLTASAQEIFGKDVDVSTYFPNQQYPVTLDLNNASQQLTKLYYGKMKDVTSQFAGPLIRAADLGVIPKTFLQIDLFNIAGSVIPSVTQSIITQNIATRSLLAPGNYIGQRALLEEVFYLHLAMLQPLELAVGMNNPALLDIENNINTISDLTNPQTQNVGINAVVNQNNYFSTVSSSSSLSATPSLPGLPPSSSFSSFGPPPPSPSSSAFGSPPPLSSASASNSSSSSESSFTCISLQNLYQNLFAMSRYVRSLYLDKTGNRTMYSCQPSDTFAGVVLLNNTTSSGTNVTPDWVFNPIASGQSGYASTNDCVDKWGCKIHTYSGEKYRSSGFTINPLGKNFSVQITEQFGGNVSEDVLQKVIPAGILIVDSANSIQDEVLVTDQVQAFFDEAPSCPWAVIIEIVDGPDAPTFQVLALARLNPFDFPFTYSGGIDGLQSFTSNTIFNARKQLQKDLMAMQGVAIETKEGIKIPETNMNLIKFNGALSYGWGGKTSIKTALENLEAINVTGTLSQSDINNAATLTAKLQTAGVNVSSVQSIEGASGSASDSSIVPVVTRKYALFNINNLGNL